MATLKDLRKGAAISRNRDMAWDRLLEKKSAERLIAVDLHLSATKDGFALDMRSSPAEPTAPYPEDSLSYLANVYNGQSAAFYAKHGVKLIGAAYESHEKLGAVPLMITKHCVRWSLSLCPKQAKGVVGVQGTVRAERMTLVHGEDTLTLRFDCKPCEMHVVGTIRKNVLRDTAREVRQAPPEAPLVFYRTRPALPLPVHPRGG